MASEAQVNVTPPMLAPPASFATALNDSVAPIEVSVNGPVGVTLMLETACATVTATALLVTLFAEAVMFAAPLATAVTVP